VDLVRDQDESASDEDEAWRSIVDNYGTRPQLPGESTDEPVGRPDAWSPADDDHFVPQVPPPVPRPERPRLIAWIGVLGAPLALLVVAIFRVPVPAILVYALIVWAVGGFGYLVAMMPRGPQDPYDDGARL
jgi:hypothetical protein